jgi:hypothetical protein
MPHYSPNATVAQYTHEQGVNGKAVMKDAKLSLAPWGVAIIKE